MAVENRRAVVKAGEFVGRNVVKTLGPNLLTSNRNLIKRAHKEEVNVLHRAGGTTELAASFFLLTGSINAGVLFYGLSRVISLSAEVIARKRIKEDRPDPPQKVVSLFGGSIPQIENN